MHCCMSPLSFSGFCGNSVLQPSWYRMHRRGHVIEKWSQVQRQRTMSTLETCAKRQSTGETACLSQGDPAQQHVFESGQPQTQDAILGVQVLQTHITAEKTACLYTAADGETHCVKRRRLHRKGSPFVCTICCETDGVPVKLSG